MNDFGKTSKEQNERLIQLLEQQLDQSLRQIEALTEQVHQLTKALYGSKSEQSKYQVPDGQGSLFEDDSSFIHPEQTEEQSTPTVTYTVVRKQHKKNGMIHFWMVLKLKKFIITLSTRNATAASAK